MNPLLNVATTSSPPPAANELLARRKRGRPRKDETLTQQQNSNVTPKSDTKLVGKKVSGVVEGCFDAGYILNVKVKDTDTKLRGIVFLPGRVTPITPENDVAPNVKMFAREEIKNDTEDHSQSQSQSQPMKDELEIAECAQTLSLLPQESNQAKEATMEKDGAVEIKEEADAKTRLVEFDLMGKEQACQGEKVAEEQQKSPEESRRGFDLMSEEEHASLKVPEELQLELGNKTSMSVDGDKNNNGDAKETDAKDSVSKSGFIANLFEGEDKKVDSDMDGEEVAPSMQ